MTRIPNAHGPDYLTADEFEPGEETREAWAIAAARDQERLAGPAAGLGEVLYGRTITIARDSTVKGGTINGYAGQAVPAVQTPDQGESTLWTIVLQVIQVPYTDASYHNPPVPDGTFSAVITYMLGGTTFTQTIVLGGNPTTFPAGMGAPIRRFPIQARRVTIDIRWDGNSGVIAPVNTFIVSVGCEKGQLNSPLFVAPSWISTAKDSLSSASKYNAVTGGSAAGPAKQGVLAAMTGVLTVAQSDGSMVYPMAFDVYDVSLVGGQPIPGTVGPGLSAVGDTFSFSDENDPQCGFTRGLVIALSTDPFQYVAPTLGAKFRVDVKAGQ